MNFFSECYIECTESPFKNADSLPVTKVPGEFLLQYFAANYYLITIEVFNLLNTSVTGVCENVSPTSFWTAFVFFNDGILTRLDIQILSWFHTNFFCFNCQANFTCNKRNIDQPTSRSFTLFQVLHGQRPA
ncbi:hypothetical protein CS542_07475 [Pedobacter sp. IW39]|nr:hypothetical protein CS542_07475 [Pedobacter sp. IW39]